MKSQSPRRPAWLKVKAFGGNRYHDIRKRLRGLTLHTVCEEANCPNRGECFGSGTATFLLLGSICTRHCSFCNILSGNPEALDPEEPKKVAELARYLELSHVVITSVTRDDLPDEGAGYFARTVTEIKKKLPEATIEILTPDFHGRSELLELALSSGPTVFNHNVETVAGLYRTVRPQADYSRSLRVLAYAADRYPDIIVKSGIMVGLGESPEGLYSLFHDLAAAGVSVLTIGQYLAPSRNHHPVCKYYTPDEFSQMASIAQRCGLQKIISGPLVRSSYRAGEILKS